MRKLPPLFLFCCIFMACCHSLDSESGLYDVTLQRSFKAGVDGAWTYGQGHPFRGQKKGRIYVAPMDITLVEKAEPERAPLLVPQMQEHMVTELDKSLQESNKANGMDWRLTDNAAEADVLVQVALVHFRPRRPGLSILSTIGGYFIKVPGVSDVVGYFAQGDIRIEAAVRNKHDGRLMMAFKDSNRKKVRLYTAEAYSRTGNADANLKAWAHKLARIFRECAPDRLGDKTLRQRAEERSLFDVVKSRFTD